jgi:hypothetical protein
MPMGDRKDPTEEKQKLRQFADELGALVIAEMRQQRSQPPLTTISHGLAGWILSGIEDYLEGKHASLNSALGLIRKGRGSARPSERARNLFEMKEMNGKSWQYIADVYPQIDVRDLQRELSRFRGRIIEERAGNVRSSLQGDETAG